jgi:hypothetical protein
MSVINKRNAVIGWIVVKLGKRAAKKKAQEVAPSARTGGALAGVLAAIGGTLFVRRRKRVAGTG